MIVFMNTWSSAPGGSFNITSATSIGSLAVASAVEGIWLSADGVNLFVVGVNLVSQYVLATPYLITSGGAAVDTYTPVDANTQGMYMRADGLKAYMVGATGDTVREYTLSSAWDLTTISSTASISINAQDTVGQDVFFKPDGTKMYVVGSTNDRVYQYTVATPWSVSTATYDTVFLAVGTQDGSPQSIFFDPTGYQMFIMGLFNSRVYQYNLTTAWDLSTASYASISFNTALTNPTGLYFTSDGTKMYVGSDATDAVYQWSLP
jgi:hypothetical protein